MERTKSSRTPSLILCSDFHLREDVPTCFVGDWHQEQWKAVERIRGLQQQYKCPVFHAGDLFHHWKPSPALISQALWFLPEQFYTIYGQHDLPQHAWELREKSGLHTLKVAGKINLLNGCHFGQTPDSNYKPITTDGQLILVWHHLTYLSKPFPGAEGGMAEGILRKYPMYNLIVCGDNHQSFSVEYKGRLLVNPGNITRQTADQIDFKPRVALWYAETNTITWVNLPKQEGVISRDHIQVKEERDARIDAFVSKLNGDYVTELSFEENLENHFKANNTRDQIKEIIYKSLEL